MNGGWSIGIFAFSSNNQRQLEARVAAVGSENLIRPQIIDLQRLAAELSPPVSRALARSDAA
jgi:hypothetical protein